MLTVTTGGIPQPAAMLVGAQAAVGSLIVPPFGSMLVNVAAVVPWGGPGVRALTIPVSMPSGSHVVFQAVVVVVANGSGSLSNRIDVPIE